MIAEIGASKNTRRMSDPMDDTATEEAGVLLLTKPKENEIEPGSSMKVKGEERTGDKCLD